ncbi:MAG: SH3 domain-containing protein [Anaerolineales bacterium]|nr:SH3 domain-containing protein [Anaerolineales bacterium]
MFKSRFVFSVLLAVIIASSSGGAYVVAAPLDSPNENSTNSYVNLYIDQIKILGNTGDITGPGEFRLIIMAADTTGKSSGMFCPGNEPLKMRKGDTINSPCLLAVSFDENKVSDGVYLTVMVVDEDKSSLPVDLSYEAATGHLSKAFGSAVKGKLVKVGASTLAKSTPFTFAVEVLFSFLSGKVKSWVEKADIIGVQGIYLSRKDNWSADKTKTVTSSDGGIQITYTIVRTFSTPPNKTAPILGSTATSSSQSSSQKYWCDDLSYVKLKVGDRAKVVWPKVNLRTAPIVPQEYYENSIAKLEEGTTLTIIGGPACAHNGTWWQVRTGNGRTGWMRERISSGYLIGR